MKTSDRLKSKGITQSQIAKIISGNPEIIPPKARVKASRIWHGAMPSPEEIKMLHRATNGDLDANFFHGLLDVAKNTHTNSQRIKNQPPK